MKDLKLPLMSDNIDKAFIEYNSNPEYLNLLETKFGTRAKDNMIDTLKIKLKRKLLGD